MLSLEQAATPADNHFHAPSRSQPQPRPLNLKAMRLAVHGWWLGNPLVYKPGVADLIAVARELAGAGAASGTLVLSDTPAGSDRPASDRPASDRPASDGTGTLSDADATSHDAVHTDHADDTDYTVHAVLILRPPMAMPRTPLGVAAAQSVAEVAQATLGRSCAVRWRWQVVLRDGSRGASRLCRVSVEQNVDAALVDMRLALGRLWQVAEDGAGQPSTALFARADWREVFLARVLHTLDGRLRVVHVA